MIYYTISLFVISIFSNLYSDNPTKTSAFNPQFYELELIPNQRVFYQNEPITVVFKNRYASVIYLIRRSSNSPILQLQKFEQNRWRNVSTARPGSGGTQVVRFRELGFGDSMSIDFPAERLVELGNEISGIYRYRLSYSMHRNTSDMVTVYSPEFEIL